MGRLVGLLLVWSCLVWSGFFVGTLWAAEPDAWVREHQGELVALYRQFHQAPELSFHEAKTAARLAAEWRRAGAEVTTGVGGHGVVAIFENGPGPTLMLRTDLDALPVTEATELKYASTVTVDRGDGTRVGVMHACGHDIHMTVMVGVARYLAAHRDTWSGRVMFIGQPAEERGAGARMMLADGLFKRFTKPDFAVALHVDSSLEAGRVGYRTGYAMANVDSVDITMKGRGGHGAAPHTAIDPVVLAAHLVVDLQTLVSREIDPVEPAVVTVGSIHGGSKHNIIGNTCKLQLTVRSYSDDVREHLLEGIQRKARAVAQGANAPEPEISIAKESTPALFNDEKLIGRMLPVFERVLGKENLTPSAATMGGEDFARYGRAGVPIAMFRLGSVAPDRLAALTRGGRQPPSLHSPVYYPDAEVTLATGIRVLVRGVQELLPSGKATGRKDDF